MIGRTIDRYTIVEKLGQGGMGVVYKARDTLLGRFVALKVLPPDSVSDAGRRRRFIEEARAASALQHPGIVTIHDVVSSGGQDVIIMELVSGGTIEQKMGHRSLPLAQALRYAEGIADALARAHAAGIVHRDLKPSNVMVTADDSIKVLDFGLAKLSEAEFSSEESPTVSAGRNAGQTGEDGAIVGTLAYMSPEQAAGRPVDARTDVFSLGVLLYEMLAGRHPFRRASQLEMLAAIREAEPAPLSEVAPGLPPEVDRAILRCLRKDPGRRWQSLSDLKAVLQDLREDSESGRARGASLPVAAPPSRARLWAAAAVLVIAGGAGAVYLLHRRGAGGAGPLDLARLTYDAGTTIEPTISADGKLIAYTSDRGGDGELDVWVQHVNQPHPARLTNPPGGGRQPSISPDGSRVAFRSERDGGGIYVVGTLGGEEKRIADGGLLPRFSPDGSQIVFVSEAAWAPRGLLKMFLVSAAGGPPRPFQPDFGALWFPRGAGPIWSPDGRSLLFYGASVKPDGPEDWWVAPVDGGMPVATGAVSALGRSDVLQFPVAWFGSHVLLTAGTTMEGVNLSRVHITQGDWKVEGPAEPLTSGTGMTLTASAAADGRIVIDRFGWVVQLWTFDVTRLNGTPSEQPRALTSDGAPKFGVSLARNGARMVYSAFSGPRGQRRTEIRIRDLASGQETAPIQAAGTSLVDLCAHLSPDGQLVTWEDTVGGRTTAFVGKAGDSTGREVCRDCTPLGFFGDSRSLLARSGPRRLVRRSLDTNAETPLLELPAGAILDADLSWDDRWLAATMGRPDGTVTLQVVPVGANAASPAQWIAITESRRELSSPRWSPDASRLYFLSARDGPLCIWAQALDPSTKRPHGEPTAVLHAHRNPLRLQGPRGAFCLSVARNRLVFNAAEITGNVLIARLPPE